MLAYLARTLPVVARAFRKNDGRLVSRLERRVRISEIDTNLHMNQAAYLRVAELGRLDWVIRSGALKAWRERELRPVVAEQRVVYRRELKPGQRYTIETRAVRIDGRLFWFEGYLLVGDRVHARVDTALITIGSGGVISAEETQEVGERFLAAPLVIEDWRVMNPS
ncbi:MAG: thioesterase family protein [Sandaracinaceae bacterium]